MGQGTQRILPAVASKSPEEKPLGKSEGEGKSTRKWMGKWNATSIPSARWSLA